MSRARPIGPRRMKNMHARPRLGPRITAMPADGDFAFGPYQLDTRLKQLVRDGAPVDLSPRQFDILHALVSRAGEILSKDALIVVGWRDVAVSDSSVEKIVFHLRQRLDVLHQRGPAGHAALIDASPLEGRHGRPALLRSICAVSSSTKRRRTGGVVVFEGTPW